MATSEKMIRQQIRKKQIELIKLKRRYFEKINDLRGQKTFLDNQRLLNNQITIATMGLAGGNRKQKLSGSVETLKNEIEATKKERDKEVEKLQKEIAHLQSQYRKNYDQYQQSEQKAKAEKRNNRKTDFILFFRRNKKIIVTFIVCAGLISLIVLVNRVLYERNKAIELGRDYHIDIQDSFTFDCNVAKNDYGGIACEEREVNGSYSNYSSVFLTTLNSEDKDSSILTNGADFTRVLSASIDQGFYQKDVFDYDALASGLDRDFVIRLYNTTLHGSVAERKVRVHYNFTNADKEMLLQFHSAWAEKKAEEEEKARKEAELKQREEEQRKKEEEQREKAEQEAEARKLQEEQQKKAAQDNGESLPDDISPYDIKALCERGFESIGYTNADISMTNQYAMGYPPYIYVVVGTLSVRSGWTSSRQQVGRIQCQANWDTWTIKSLWVNGNQVY